LFLSKKKISIIIYKSLVSSDSSIRELAFLFTYRKIF